MKKALFIAALLMGMAALPLSVHGSVLPFNVYSIDDGLNQSVVRAILQDHKGYLWFGTQDGVSRFDGLEFIPLAFDDEQISVSVMSLLEDSSGRLWIGTDGDGLYCLHENGVEVLEVEGGRGENTIHTLYEDADGVIYAVPETGGVYVFSGDRMFRMDQTARIMGRVFDAAFLENGDILMATEEQGLVRISGGDLITGPQPQGLAATNLKSVMQAANGDVWLGTEGSGLCRIRDRQATCWSVEVGLAGNVVRDVFEDSGGVIWAATDHGVSRVLVGDEGVSIISYGRDNGLPVDRVMSIFQDREGKLWFGTGGGGVARLETEMFEHFTAAMGLPESLVYSIGEDGQGGYYFGTGGGGVGFLQDGRISTINSSDGLAGDTVYSIRMAEDGAVWFASYGQGVSCLRDGRFTTLTRKDGLAADKVFYIYARSNGELWFATHDGVSIYHDGLFTPLFPHEQAADPGEQDQQIRDGFPTDMILSIMEDSSGRMWLSTYTHGLISWKAGQMDIYDEESGLPSNKVYAMFEDDQGVLWFGTDRGLARLDEGGFTTFTTRDGLSNNKCFSITQDDRGYLWIATNRGLNRFDQEEFRVYTVRDGLLTNEFNDGAVFKDSQGQIWLGTILGVTRLEPDKDLAATTPPPIYLEGVSVNEEPVDMEEEARFEHSENYFSFHFAAPYFSSPRDLTYQYMLEGLDHGWRVTDQHSVQYASLSPGQYRFRVLARNRDNVASVTEAVYSFSILSPFWLRPWFLLLSMCLGLSLLYAGYRFQVRRVRARNEQLESLIKERTRDLEEEKNTSERLLCNILPLELVSELKDKGRTTPRRYDNVSILFTDFTGFTTTSSTLPAEHLVGELNEMFNAFDDIIDRYSLEKIKTIGDAYMVAGGLPKETKDHALKCVKAALDMQEYLEGRNRVSMIKWHMRAGVHSGTVVAGVVGRLKFTYDVWGNTVNIASRMESACEAGRVNVSAFTYFLVKDHVESQYRGKIEIKGKGEMDMYFIDGLREKDSTAAK